MVRKIKEKHNLAPIHHLKQHGRAFTTKDEIANVLGQTIQLNFSSDNYSPEFKRVKEEAERTNIDFRFNSSKAYNDSITMRQLVDAIHSGKSSLPCPDNIHYKVIKRFPTATVVHLLGLLYYYVFFGHRSNNKTQQRSLRSPKLRTYFPHQLPL